MDVPFFQQRTKLTVVEDTAVMCGSWPSRNNVCDPGLVIAHNLDINRAVALSIAKQFPILTTWIGNGNVGAVNSPNYSRKTCSPIESSCCLSPRLKTYILTLQSGNCLRHSSDNPADCGFMNSKKIPVNQLKTAGSVKSQCY